MKTKIKQAIAKVLPDFLDEDREILETILVEAGLIKYGDDIPTNVDQAYRDAIKDLKKLLTFFEF